MSDDLRYKLGIDGSSASRTLGQLQGGIGSLHGALLSLGAIGLFTKVLKDGFEFNQTLHDGELAIAAIIQQFQKLDETAAKEVAAGAMKKIVELEPKVAGSLSDLVQGFASTAAAAAGVGISVDQNIDLVGRFANALGKLALPIDQVGQEMRSILTGNIGQDSQLARVLGITNEMVASAKDAGQLYAMLSSKIGKLGEAGDNAATRFSSLASAMDKAKGAIAEGIFDQALDGSVELTKALNENIDAFRDLGKGISTLTTKTVEAISTVNDWAKALGITASVYADMFTNGTSYADAMANAEDALTDAINERSKAETDAANNAPKAEPSTAPYADVPAKKKGSQSDEQRKRELQDSAQARNALLGELAILELQIKGHDAKAAAIQRQLKIQTDVLDIMRKTGASEEESLRLATRKADLEDKLEKRKKRGHDDGKGPGKHIGGVTAKHGLSDRSGSMAGGGLDEFNRLQQKHETSGLSPARAGYKRGAYLPTFFNSLSDRSGSSSAMNQIRRGLSASSGQSLSGRVARATTPSKAPDTGSKGEDPTTGTLNQILAELKRIRTA